MFIPTLEGAAAPTVLPADSSANSSPNSSADSPNTQTLGRPTGHSPEAIRHMLFGSLCAVQATIHHLHKLRYAEVDDWSQPIPTGRPNEVMAILTKKVRAL